MVWLPMVKKIEDIFIRFDIIHERDRHTDERTDGRRMTAQAALMHSIARQKLTGSQLNLPHATKQKARNSAVAERPRDASCH